MSSLSVMASLVCVLATFYIELVSCLRFRSSLLVLWKLALFVSCQFSATTCRLCYFWCLCSQIIHLTAIVVKSTVHLPQKLSVCLSGVQIAHHEVEDAFACVHDFLRGPVTTQRNCFSESGFSMLKKAVSSARTICDGSAFDPLGSIGVCDRSIISDSRACLEKLMVRHKTSKEFRECWFDVDSMASSLLGGGSARLVFGPQTLLRWKDVRYLDDSHSVSLPGTGCSHCSAGEEKRRRSFASLILKNNSSAATHAPAHTSSEAAREKSFAESGERWSGRDWQKASTFMGVYKKQLSCIYLYTSRNCR